jgi:hypothetical protein
MVERRGWEIEYGGEQLMSKKTDIEALVHFLNYSEQEAKRLGVPAVVAFHLHVATKELAKSASSEFAEHEVNCSPVQH